MFAHAWFQHREIFWKIEGEEGLYVFYKTVCDVYSLMPADTYTVPSEAEGLSAAEDSANAPRHGDGKRGTPSSQTPTSELPIRPKIDREGTVMNVSEPGIPNSTLSTAATTKRHKHTPSTGSFVPTITEDEENEDRNSSNSQAEFNEDEALSTVRYDPKDFHPAPPPEYDIDDATSEVTMIIDPPAEEVAGNATAETSSDAVDRTADKLDEEAKSPITPIDDEPSPEDNADPAKPQSKEDPSEANELTSGSEAEAVSDVPREESAVADEEKNAAAEDTQAQSDGSA